MELTNVLLIIISTLLAFISSMVIAIYNSFENFKNKVGKDLTSIEVSQAEQRQRIKQLESKLT